MLLLLQTGFNHVSAAVVSAILEIFQGWYLTKCMAPRLITKGKRDAIVH